MQAVVLLPTEVSARPASRRLPYSARVCCGAEGTLSLALAFSASEWTRLQAGPAVTTEQWSPQACCDQDTARRLPRRLTTACCKQNRCIRCPAAAVCVRLSLLLHADALSKPLPGVQTLSSLYGSAPAGRRTHECTSTA